MFEVTDLGRCEGTSNDVRAMRSQYSDKVSVGLALRYAHESLFIDIGLINPAVLDNQLTQLLNRRLRPTVDLTSLSASTKKTEASVPTWIERPLKSWLPEAFPLGVSPISEFCICNFARLRRMYSPNSPNRDAP